MSQLILPIFLEEMKAYADQLPRLQPVFVNQLKGRGGDMKAGEISDACGELLPIVRSSRGTGGALGLTPEELEALQKWEEQFPGPTIIAPPLERALLKCVSAAALRSSSTTGEGA